MKSLRYSLVIAVLLLAALAEQLPAQEWGPEIQVTSSVDDDRNVCVFLDDTLTCWVFWDRPVGSARQIFYRKFNHNGQLISEEIQLTFGPESNQSPKIGTPIQPFICPWDPLLTLCWEHGEAPNRDIYFAYNLNNQWSPVQVAFNSLQDEYNPWTAGASHYFNYHHRLGQIISAQLDSSILAKCYLLLNDHLELIDSVEIVRTNPISNLTCHGGEGAAFVLWQTMTQVDTTLEFCKISFHPHGVRIDTLEIGVNSIQGPKIFGLSDELHWIYYSHFLNGFWRVGMQMVRGSGILGPSYLDYFNSAQGNQYEPFIIPYGSPLLETDGVFVSPDEGDDNVYLYRTSETSRVSLSNFGDVHPCYTIPIWSYMPMHYRYIVFWESSRNGNWDIYGRTSEEYYTGVLPDSGVITPGEFSVAVTPNPSNAQFRLSLDLPRAGRVSAKVFDINGRAVAEICDQSYPSGRQVVGWDATGIPSGIYLLRVESPAGILTEKVVLLK